MCSISLDFISNEVSFTSSNFSVSLLKFHSLLMIPMKCTNNDTNNSISFNNLNYNDVIHLIRLKILAVFQQVILQVLSSDNKFY